MKSGNLALIPLAGALLGGAWLFWTSSNDQSSAERAYDAAQASDQTAVDIPELTPQALAGRGAFNEICAACHGRDAAGGTGGPPLIHKIYEPAHHADISFHRAVAYGVKAHHWRFGDMPPLTDVAPDTVDDIIAFVRQTQRANGIN